MKTTAVAMSALALSVVASSNDLESRTQAQGSFEQGRANAKETLQDLGVDGAGPLASKPAGIIIAEGDSWFAYPGLDVLGAMEKGRLAGGVRYRIYSAADAGDTVEEMAYDGQQREAFAGEFKKVLDAGAKDQVRAILLSGGGNDIAGREFHILLNHARSLSGITSPLDDPLADAFIDRIGRNLESLIGTASAFAQDILGRTDIPILIHGYAPPVPDGRPFLFGGVLPGPWLQPGFAVKGYLPDDDPDALARNTKVMAGLIERFNTRVARIPASLAPNVDVRYVDVRKMANNTVAGGVYKSDWSNELHPRDSAFIRVAQAFHERIVKK